MLSRDELKEMRVSANALIETHVIGHPSYSLAEQTIKLLDEIERMRKVHTEEQRRSADRLREAQLAASAEAQLVDELQAWRAKENQGRCYDGG